MRCAVMSVAGQTLAFGRLCLEADETGQLCLVLRTDRGTRLVGGPVGADGDLGEASQQLFRQILRHYGVDGVRLSIQPGRPA